MGLAFTLWLLATTSLDAASTGGSITDRSIAWPTADEWLRVFTLRDYNTRVVLTGTTLLGFAAGVLGCFTLLREMLRLGLTSRLSQAG